MPPEASALALVGRDEAAVTSAGLVSWCWGSPGQSPSHGQRQLPVSAGQFSSCSTVAVPLVRSRHCGCVQQPNIFQKQTGKRYFLTYRCTAVTLGQDPLVQGGDLAGATLCPEQLRGSWEWGLEICLLLPGLLSLTALSPGNSVVGSQLPSRSFPCENRFSGCYYFVRESRRD